MTDKSEEISLVMKQNSVRILLACKAFGKHPVFGLIANQVCRASTSAGANYEEACGAESKSDFIHKLHITYKELRETKYWLSIIKSSELTDFNNLDEAIQKNEELIRIIGKSIVTCKRNSGKL